MRIRFWKKAPAIPIVRGPKPGILYQDYGLEGSALWYIDQGWRNAFTAEKHRWAQWNHTQPVERLIDTITRLKPTLLLLNLQTIQRQPSPWTNPPALKKLLALKNKLGFHVACRSNPSNIVDLFRESPIDFETFRENVSSFYLQPDHPNGQEVDAFESGFIDVVRTAFSSTTFPVAFRNYLKIGCRVLEEPHAADLIAYPPALNAGVPKAANPDFDILFVGGCWPFKYANMKPYVRAMKQQFGERFKIFGKGWPDDLSNGRLPESQYNSTLQSAKISLTLHELSQTLPDPISGNERIFKLGALGCCTLSDNNPLNRRHFTDHEVRVCRSPDDMVDQAERLLADPELRIQLAKAQQNRVVSEHSYQIRLNRIFATIDTTESIVPYKPAAIQSTL